MTEYEQSLMILQLAADRIGSWLDGRQPEFAITLGSGLGAVADEVTDAIRLDSSAIPGFQPSTVEGHRGELIAGVMGGKSVLVQCGRSHMYEGHTAFEASMPVRAFAACGVTNFIVTNAAGGIKKDLMAGDLMLITDHLNFTGRNPSVGAVLPGEERFRDMGAAYDRELREIALSVARESGLKLAHGVYAGVLGPSFETPAEIAMLRSIGADAVGMSTVVEVIAARARGLRCLGISLISNATAEDGGAELSHREVLETVTASSGPQRLAKLIEGVLISA
jgi:purine-nucleoside phosphorylase